MTDRAETEPCVGVFYWIDGQAYARSKSLSVLTKDPSTGDLVSFSTHFSLWSHLRATKSDFSAKDDSFFPRGRVLFNLSKDLFILRMDQCVPMWALPNILSTFNLSDLPPEKLHIVHGADPQSGDHHYQCHQCGPATRRRVV